MYQTLCQVLNIFSHSIHKAVLHGGIITDVTPAGQMANHGSER